MISKGASSVTDRRFLVIAGEPKAGTTSLYRWLSFHPDIGASVVKETRFFLDRDYPLARPSTYNGTNLDSYLELFRDTDRNVLLEATPDYLYNRLPLVLPQLLPECRVVIIRRDPVSRMISAYEYFRQRGLLPKNLSFDDYVLFQSRSSINPETPVPYRTLDQCRESYLKAFRTAFGLRLLELPFDRLKSDPLGVVAEVCRFSGIDPESLSVENFATSNKTRVARSPGVVRLFDRLRLHISHRLRKRSKMRAWLRPMSRNIRKHLFVKEGPFQIQVGDQTVALIRRWVES
nr:sulfotransferase domain-containing protein [Wenzhouxiangella sp. XN201]